MSEASNNPTEEIIAKKERNFSLSQSDGERGNATRDRRAKTPDDGGEYWTGPSLFSGIPGGLEPSETKTKSAPKERHMRAGIEPGATYMRSLSFGQTKKDDNLLGRAVLTFAFTTGARVGSLLPPRYGHRRETHVPLT